MELASLKESSINVVKNTTNDIISAGILATTTLNGLAETAISPVNSSDSSSDGCSSGECHKPALSEILVRESVVDFISKDNHDRPKSTKAKKTKKKSKINKNDKSKYSLSASQNESKDENDIPQNSSLKKVVNISSPPTLPKEDENPFSMSQRYTPTRKDDMSKTEALEAKISETETLVTGSTNTGKNFTASIQDDSPTNIASQDMMSSVPTILKDQEQGIPANGNKDSKNSFSDIPAVDDNPQNEHNVSKSPKAGEAVNGFSELKTPELVVSTLSTDNLVEHNTYLDSDLLVRHLISDKTDNKGGSDIFKAETASIFQLDEDSIVPTPVDNERQLLESDKTSMESLRKTSIHEENMELTVESENSVLPPVESNSAFISTITANSEGETAKDFERASSKPNEKNSGEIHLGSSIQEPELPTVTQVIGTHYKSQQVPVNQESSTIKSQEDNKITVSHLYNTHDVADIASELASSHSINEISTSPNEESFEVQKLLNNTVCRDEVLAEEVLCDAKNFKPIVQHEVPISDKFALFDRAHNNDTKNSMTVQCVLERGTNTSKAIYSESKEYCEESDLTATKSKEDKSISIVADQNDINEREVFEVRAESLVHGVISKDEEFLDNSSFSIQAFQSKNSECLSIKDNESWKEKEKESNPDIMTYTTNPEVGSMADKNQTHFDSAEMENFEKWKISLQNTADKAMSLIDSKVTQVSNLMEMFEHSMPESSNNEQVISSPKFDKNKTLHIQRSTGLGEVEKIAPLDISSNVLGSDISICRGKSDSAIELNEGSCDGGALGKSQIAEVFGSSVSQTRVGNLVELLLPQVDVWALDTELIETSKESKLNDESSEVEALAKFRISEASRFCTSQAESGNNFKLKFKPRVEEQVLAPELITISNKTLEHLYKRLDSMQSEIDQLSSALKIQNPSSWASKHESNSSLKLDYSITKSSQRKSRPSNEEVRMAGLLKSSSKKSDTKDFSLWSFLSVFGFSTTKNHVEVITRSSDLISYPSPQSYKGKGKERLGPNSSTGYKVIGKVRSKHDKS